MVIVKCMINLNYHYIISQIVIVFNNQHLLSCVLEQDVLWFIILFSVFINQNGLTAKQF